MGDALFNKLDTFDHYISVQRSNFSRQRLIGKQPGVLGVLATRRLIHSGSRSRPQSEVFGCRPACQVNADFAGQLQNRVVRQIRQHARITTTIERHNQRMHIRNARRTLAGRFHGVFLDANPLCRGNPVVGASVEPR